MFISYLARQHSHGAQVRQGQVLMDLGPSHSWDTFPSQSLTIQQGKRTQSLNIKSIVWLIFRKVFPARAGGTFPLVLPDFCGDLRCRQLLVPAAPEAGPACHFPQQPTSGLLARLMNIIEDRIKGRSFLGSRRAVFLVFIDFKLGASTALVCTGARFTYSPLPPLVFI